MTIYFNFSCLSRKLRSSRTFIEQICRVYSSSASTMETATKLRLSEKLSSLVRPVHYDLTLRPNMDTGLFKGTVKIDVIVKQEKSYITLHSNFLEITSVKVYRAAEEIAVSKFLEIKQIEQLLLQFDRVLDSGTYRIDIDFNGSLTRNIIGFYLSRLKDNRYISGFILCTFYINIHLRQYILRITKSFHITGPW